MLNLFLNISIIIFLVFSLILGGVIFVFTVVILGPPILIGYFLYEMIEWMFKIIFETIDFFKK